jgi:hypothetical protein
MLKHSKKFRFCVLCEKPNSKKYASKFCSRECRIVYRRRYRQLWYQNNKKRIKKLREEKAKYDEKKFYEANQEKVDLTNSTTGTLEK